MTHEDLQQTVEQRIQTWESALTRELEQTTAQAERDRIQRELVELGARRDRMEGLDASQLQKLSEHLARDPRAWLRHEA